MAIYDNRVCKQCGRNFSGGPRAWYCPYCRYERRKEKDRKYHKDGSMRKIGDTDFCVNCGKPYTITSGMQKYCPDCALACIREIDRQQSLALYHRKSDEISEQRKSVRRKKKIEITCEVCGKTFLGRKNQKFCSEGCRIKSRQIYSRDYERNHPGRKKK